MSLLSFQKLKRLKLLLLMSNRPAMTFCIIAIVYLVVLDCVLVGSHFATFFVVTLRLAS